MKEIAATHKNQLKRIKSNIDNSWQNSSKNIDRYNEYRRFVFVTSISESQNTILAELKRPKVEFNILEAFISRLIGEFSKAEPSIRVSPADGKDVDPETLQVVEGHLRYALEQAAKDGMQYNVYRDTLSGGFSSMKIYTEYSGEMSFHQDICMRRVYDPTLVGFDPLAVDPDKGDGDYCFELVPKRVDDFKEEYPEAKIDAENRNYSTGDQIGPFSMAIKTGKDAIVLVADYYEKKKVQREIVMLANGEVMTTKEYKEFLQKWEMAGQIAQPPAIVGKPRKTEITKIVRYKLIENQVLDYEETDFKQLPIIFIDGNSILGKENTVGPVTQITRPYVFQAKGAQQLKNLSGQQLCNELENLGPPKTVVSLEAIPEKYLVGYTDPQSAVVQIYNAFHNGDPNLPLQPPQQQQRPQIPAEITNAFVGSDALVQTILGSFDANMAKLTKEEVSGVAIQETAVLSNAAALPYIVNYLKGLESAAQCFVNLLPLYYRTPRTIPTISKEGRRGYVKINGEDGLSFDYDHDAISVTIEAGPSFTVQKTRALQQIISLMNASPMFAQFINEAGQDIVLDNVDIRNIETLKERSDQWIQQMQQAKQQQGDQPAPEQMAIQVAQQQVQSEYEAAMAKVQQTAAAEQIKAELKMQEMDLEKQKLLLEMAKLKADYELGLAKLGIEQQNADSKAMRDLVDASIKTSAHHHEVDSKGFDKAMRVMEHLANNSETEEKEMEKEDEDEQGEVV